jgi:basic amino acid/polyamine antiporter, APA family
MMADSTQPNRLTRKLGLWDAVTIGLGSMIGAGVFSSFAPAARAAGSGLLVGLFIAGFVAFCNATSSARLAALYPEAGGTYVYGRARLNPFWGFIAGWGFVVGKTASCAAMALTFGHYALPDHARSLAIVAVIAMTIVNYFGVKKTVALTQGIVALVLVSLGAAIAAIWMGGSVDSSAMVPYEAISIRGALQAAGFLFFAFAGYARLATLGEEVIEPQRVIPRAIPLALGIAFLVYAVVALSLLASLGPEAIATAAAPLATAVLRGSFAHFAPIVRIGATLASLGALLSLILGISRTLFAMARQGDMPSFLAKVHPRFGIPHRAELAVGGLVVAIVASFDLRAAIGFSSFTVLIYYAIANAAAWTLPSEHRRWPRAIAVLGAAGCVTLTVMLPVSSVVGGVAVLLAGAVLYGVRTRN